MTIKTLPDAVQRDRLRAIELRWFFKTLELPPNLRSGADVFDNLALLRKHGLRLYEPGGNLASVDAVDVALAKVEADHLALEEENEAAPVGVNVWTEKRTSAMWSHSVATVKNPDIPKGAYVEDGEWYMVELSRGMDSYSIPVGSLLVKEEDYARVCRRLGMDTYYWPRVDWPQESKHLEERSTSEPSVGAASLPPCEENVVGFLPLKEAVNLIIGAPESFPMNAGHPGWLLWQAALSAKQRSWPVRECERIYRVGQASDEWRFVHVGDFLRWALETGEATWPEGGIWTPEKLVAERARVEGARDRPGCPLDEQDEATRRIRWVEELLRRFAAAGVERPPSVAPISERFSFESDPTGSQPANGCKGKAEVGTVQQKRERRLQQWLDEKEIPEDRRHPLELFTLREIYKALSCYPEFRSDHGAGRPIEFSTFDRKFWQQQDIAKLPDLGRKGDH